MPDCKVMIHGKDRKIGAMVKALAFEVDGPQSVIGASREFHEKSGVETNHRLDITQQRYVSTAQLRQLYFVEEVRLDESLRFDEEV